MFLSESEVASTSVIERHPFVPVDDSPMEQDRVKHELGRLLEQIRPMLWGLARQHLRGRCRADVEDAVQEISLRLLTAMKRWDGVGSRATTYAHAVAHNRLVDIRRKALPGFAEYPEIMVAPDERPDRAIADASEFITADLFGPRLGPWFSRRVKHPEESPSRAGRAFGLKVNAALRLEQELLAVLTAIDPEDSLCLEKLKHPSSRLSRSSNHDRPNGQDLKNPISGTTTLPLAVLFDALGSLSFPKARVPLTREMVREIQQCVAAGHSNSTIARALKIPRTTVQWQRSKFLKIRKEPAHAA